MASFLSRIESMQHSSRGSHRRYPFSGFGASHEHTGAVSIAGARYPGCETKLVPPVEPETFFLPRASGGAEPTGVEFPEKIAG